MYQGGCKGDNLGYFSGKSQPAPAQLLSQKRAATAVTAALALTSRDSAQAPCRSRRRLHRASWSGSEQGFARSALSSISQPCPGGASRLCSEVRDRGARSLRDGARHPAPCSVPPDARRDPSFRPALGAAPKPYDRIQVTRTKLPTLGTAARRETGLALARLRSAPCEMYGAVPQD